MSDGIEKLSIMLDSIRTERFRREHETWFTTYSIFIGDDVIDEAKVMWAVEQFLFSWGLYRIDEDNHRLRKQPGVAGYELSYSGYECHWKFTVITDRAHRPKHKEFTLFLQ